MYRVVIPARYASTRLPGKALLSIAGRPMIQWVYERACATSAAEVLIATDDLLIVSAAHSFGAETVMTAATHESGTDRIAEVARLRGWADSDIVVNVQGDEPSIPPALIDQVASLLAKYPSAHIGTLATPVTSLEEHRDPNAVKVVTDMVGRALYFSRAPIPCDRDAATSFANARRHVGIYGYRVNGLLRMASLERTALERLEKLEQLRALENGLEIRVADCVEMPGPDINTPADFERVTRLLGR